MRTLPQKCKFILDSLHTLFLKKIKLIISGTKHQQSEVQQWANWLTLLVVKLKSGCDDSYVLLNSNIFTC